MFDQVYRVSGNISDKFLIVCAARVRPRAARWMGTTKVRHRAAPVSTLRAIRQRWGCTILGVPAQPKKRKFRDTMSTDRRIYCGNKTVLIMEIFAQQIRKALRSARLSTGRTEKEINELAARGLLVWPGGFQK